MERVCVITLLLIDAAWSDESRCAQIESGSALLQIPLARKDVELNSSNKTALGRPRALSPLASLAREFDQVTASSSQNVNDLGLRMLQGVDKFLQAQWSRWLPKVTFKEESFVEGMHAMIVSVTAYDWVIFACALVVFLILRMVVLNRLDAKGWNVTILVIWLTLGVAYNVGTFMHFGYTLGISWFIGYILELFFLVENAFIFHIVLEAFKTPRNFTTKALLFVVWGQIMFELLFFIGLAAWLRSFKVLPYALGLWLIFFGIWAIRGGPSMDFNMIETGPCRACISFLGGRLSPSYNKDGRCLITDDVGRIQISLLGPVVFMLLLVDFFLEIDVVLVKIEELPNPYIAFTSSALAAFSIPELCIVNERLLKHCVMLKYGLGLVLILFGTQLLLSKYYTMKPTIVCAIIVGILTGCVCVSFFFPLSGMDQPHMTPVVSEAGDFKSGTGTPSTSNFSPLDGGRKKRASERGDENVAP